MWDKEQYRTGLISLVALAAFCYIETFHRPIYTAAAFALLCVELFGQCLNWAETRAEIKRVVERHKWREQKHYHILRGGAWNEQSDDADFDKIIKVGTPEYTRPKPHLDNLDDG